MRADHHSRLISSRLVAYFGGALGDAAPARERPLARNAYGRCVYTVNMPQANERWDFRVASRTDTLVRRAADATDRTLTEFVVDAAASEAERILADRTRFALGPEQWARFTEILDRPPQDNPRLRKLFSRPSAFAER